MATNRNIGSFINKWYIDDGFIDKVIYNDKRQLHCEDGPAVYYNDFYKQNVKNSGDDIYWLNDVMFENEQQFIEYKINNLLKLNDDIC